MIAKQKSKRAVQRCQDSKKQSGLSKHQNKMLRVVATRAAASVFRRAQPPAHTNPLAKFATARPLRTSSFARRGFASPPPEDDSSPEDATDVDESSDDTADGWRPTVSKTPKPAEESRWKELKTCRAARDPKV